MPTLQELSVKVDDLQVALDAEQQQVTDLLTANQTTVDSLNAVVTDLTAQVVSGGTEAERQAILDKLNSAIADIQTTVAP